MRRPRTPHRWQRRVPRGAGWTRENATRATLIVLSIVVVNGCGADTSGSARGLLQAATTADYPSVYRFVDTPDAAGLMACLGGDQTISGVVDTVASIAAFGVESKKFPTVIWTPERTYVWADLVVGEPTTDWLAVESSSTSALKAALGAALGPSLEVYALATELPGHPRDLALSASKTSTSIEFADSKRSGDQLVTVLVANDVLSTGPVDSPPADDLQLGFVIGDEGRVESVEVHSATGASDAESFGFTLNFDWNAESTVLTVPLDEDVTRISDAGQLKPADRNLECVLGS